MSDKEIVERVLLDHSFFYCIVEHYEKRLRQFVYRQSGLSDMEIDDVLQEAFINVFKNLRDFDFDLKFQNWLYRIVRNATIDYLRRNNKHRMSVLFESSDNKAVSWIEKIGSDEDLELDFQKKIEIRDLEAIIGSLPDLYRDVAVLRFFEDRDYTEISDIVEKPIGTVGSLVNRARKLIFEKLKKGGSN